MPLVLLASGCASVFGSPGTGPAGLSVYDHELRSLLSQGRYDSAMARVAPERSKAGDELLRLHNQVLVGHHAGHLRESADALEAAVELADDRYTRSVSRAVLSAFTNDRILPYRPPPTERLLLHYYGALVHLRLDGPPAAAVEARRLEARLVSAEDEREPVGARRDLHVALHRIAGAIFEAAGERNAAEVAHRRAERLERRSGAGRETTAGADASSTDPEPAGRADTTGPSRAPGGAAGGTAGDGPDHGEVLVVVEQGFVAHRVERSLNVLVWPDEMKRLAGASDSADDEGRYATALSVARRTLSGAGEAGSPRRGEDPRPEAPAASDRADCGTRVVPGVGRVVTTCAGAGERLSRRRAARAPEGTPRLLRVAWPEYRTGSPPARVHVRTTGQGGPRARWGADVSAAVVEEYGERAPEVLAKALLRAVVKNVVADEVAEEVEEEDETLGEVTGVALNALGALTERADTRSWSLLPGRIELVRLRLPAGEHRLELSAEGGDRPMESLEVRVPAGGVALASARLWR